MYCYQIYMQILAHTDIHPLITVSVYASIKWKYIHVQLQSRQYTAHRKSYTFIFVHIRTYTEMYVSSTAIQYMIRTSSCICRICMYIWTIYVHIHQ